MSTPSQQGNSARRTNPTIATAALQRIEEAKDQDALEQVRVDALGRKGALAQFNVGKLAPRKRKFAGQALNAAKQTIESAFETKKLAFAAEALNLRLKHEWIDLTLPAPGVRPGSLHPVTIIQNEIEDLFTSLAFAVLDGPRGATQYHNFDALKISPSIPRVICRILSGWPTGTCCAPTHRRCKCAA